MAWYQRDKFTQEEMKAFTTLAHPFAIYIPGKETSMGLVGALHMLCRGEEFIIWDGGFWLSPLGIFFKRSEDCCVITDFLAEWNVKYALES